MISHDYLKAKILKKIHLEATLLGTNFIGESATKSLGNKSVSPSVFIGLRRKLHSILYLLIGLKDSATARISLDVNFDFSVYKAERRGPELPQGRIPLSFPPTV